VSLGAKQGFGIATDPDNPRELVEQIRTLATDGVRLKRMGEAALVAAHGYDRVKELQKFVAITGRVAAQGKN